MNYAVELELRKVELKLEEIGSSICGLTGSSQSWSYINVSLENLRKAIRTCYLIEDK